MRRTSQVIAAIDTSRQPAGEGANRMQGRSPVTDPHSARETLAARLSREMMEAERQGFGTSTVWLTREETDLICAALRTVSGGDSGRLDFMDRCVAALSARDGAIRSWRVTIDQGGLTLSAASSAQRHAPASSVHASCRAAIDERIAELDSARAITADGQAGYKSRA